MSGGDAAHRGVAPAWALLTDTATEDLRRREAPDPVFEAAAWVCTLCTEHYDGRKTRAAVVEHVRFQCVVSCSLLLFVYVHADPAVDTRSKSPWMASTSCSSRARSASRACPRSCRRRPTPWSSGAICALRGSCALCGTLDGMLPTSTSSSPSPNRCSFLHGRRHNVRVPSEADWTRVELILRATPMPGGDADADADSNSGTSA